MLLIVIGLAIADYITGLIKAYCRSSLSSSKMRKGGLNKLGEIIVMLTACGLDIGIHTLGKYYNAGKCSETDKQYLLHASIIPICHFPGKRVTSVP